MNKKLGTPQDLTLSEAVQLIDETFGNITVEKIGTPDKSQAMRDEVEKLNKLGFGAGAFWRLIK